ncbi:MAG: hypothetical protein GY750_15390 [Lentisphaerae bacterium]|nr:hypothetical protein [Lentisphaerota bacterium]MCP4102782.1 hypothetical protein [Lentisphaerota bacterium]
MKRLISILLLLCFVISIFSAEKNPGTVVIKADNTARMHYKLLPVMSLDFEVIKRVCKPWLHKEGKLTYEKYQNSVLVYDTPEVIDRVRRFIKNNDTPSVNIRIDIKTQSVSPDNQSRFGYRKAPPGQPVIVTY